MVHFEFSGMVPSCEAGLGKISPDRNLGSGRSQQLGQNLYQPNPEDQKAENPRSRRFMQHVGALEARNAAFPSYRSTSSSAALATGQTGRILFSLRDTRRPTRYQVPRDGTDLGLDETLARSQIARNLVPPTIR